MSAGFVIAKPGIDAGSARIQDTYTTTEAPILKVLDRGSGKVAFGVGETDVIKDVSIYHNLSYRPLVQVFCDRAPLTNMRMMQSTVQADNIDKIYGIVAVESNRLLMRFQSDSLLGDPAGEYRYFYYIFADDSDE